MNTSYAELLARNGELPSIAEIINAVAEAVTELERIGLLLPEDEPVNYPLLDALARKLRLS